MFGTVSTDGGDSRGIAWVDYDNDEFPDLFVANDSDMRSFLYRNNRNGTFTRINHGAIALDLGAFGGSWADYDNDGFLDLFAATISADKPNALYHNEGNGKFVKAVGGGLATDVTRSVAGIWGDFDNDGFVDLFVANNGGRPGAETERNFLYRPPENRRI